jgi:hypothetical protein
MSVGIYCNLRKVYVRCIHFICDTTLICNNISPGSMFPTNQRWTYFIKPRGVAKDERKFTWHDHQQDVQELWCLTPLSTIFQLYRGGRCYWWGKQVYLEKITIVVIGNDCIGRCRSNCHIITTTTAPLNEMLLDVRVPSKRKNVKNTYNKHLHYKQ